MWSIPNNGFLHDIKKENGVIGGIALTVTLTVKKKNILIVTANFSVIESLTVDPTQDKRFS